MVPVLDQEPAVPSVNAASDYRWLRFVIISMVSCLLAALVSFSLWHGFREYQGVVRNVELLSNSYARALKEHAERTFSEADLIIQTTVDKIERSGDLNKINKNQLDALLKLNSSGIADFGSLAVIDQAGQMRATSVATSNKLPNAAGRPCYRFHYANNANTLFISPPFKSDLTGRWQFSLSRRITTPSGAFAGIVVLAIETRYFEELYMPIVSGKNGRVTLAATAGDYLVLVPIDEKVYENGKQTAAFFQQLSAIQSAHTYHNKRSNIAGEYRIVSYNRLDKYPVVAIMSFGREQAIAEWRASISKQGITISLLCLLVMVLTRLLLKQIRQLDHKVMERTSLLLAANQQLEKEVEERGQIEANLLGQQQKMEQMAIEISLAEDRERCRIASELHDQVGQRLILCKIKLDGLASEAFSRESQQTALEVDRLVEQSLQDIRSLTFQLRPPILASAGLLAALQWLVAELKQDYGLAIEMDTNGYDTSQKPIRYDVRSTLFQTTRELLLNAAKHAAGASVLLFVERNDEQMVICVADDGPGFSVDGGLGKTSRRGGFGLYDLRQKIEYLGGHLVIDTAPGAGTRVAMVLPMKNSLLEEFCCEPENTDCR